MVLERKASEVVRLNAVEVARLMAAEIWRAERAHEHIGVHGLNSERAVRERLQKIAMELEATSDVPSDLALALLGINWSDDDPLTILEKTEYLLRVDRPGAYAGADELLAGATAVTQQLLRAVVVESIAGRLGRWAVRSAEIPDARTARTLFKDLGEAHWSQYRALLLTSDELYKANRFRDSAISLLDADRLVRTAAGLLQASIALTKAGDFISALWAVRASLLEAKTSFESEGQRIEALELEGRLRAVIEGRAAAPLALEEAQLLVGDTEVPPAPKKVLLTQRAVLTAKSAPPKPKKSDPYAVRTLVDRRAGPAGAPLAQAVTKELQPSLQMDEPAGVRVSASDEAIFEPVLPPHLPPGDEETEIPAERAAPKTIASESAIPPPLPASTPSSTGQIARDLSLPRMATAPKTTVSALPPFDDVQSSPPPLGRVAPHRPRTGRWRARLPTQPPSLEHHELLRAERDPSTEDVKANAPVRPFAQEESTEIPRPPRAAAPGDEHFVRTRVVGVDPRKAKPPIVARRATLPPNPLHRELLRAEQLQPELPSPWEEAKLAENEVLQLVSETFDLDIDWAKAPDVIDTGLTRARAAASRAKRRSPGGELASTIDDWTPVPLGDDAFVEIVAVQEDTPTDTAAPIPIPITASDVLDAQSLNPSPRATSSPLTGAAAHEVTERIRDRNRAQPSSQPN